MSDEVADHLRNQVLKAIGNKPFVLVMVDAPLHEGWHWNGEPFHTIGAGVCPGCTVTLFGRAAMALMGGQQQGMTPPEAPE